MVERSRPVALSAMQNGVGDRSRARNVIKIRSTAIRFGAVTLLTGATGEGNKDSSGHRFDPCDLTVGDRS
jgi:hypothetical protein